MLKSIYNTLLFKVQERLFKAITNGKNAWLIFDKCNIPGFGTNLLRLYFPAYYDDKKSSDSFSDDFKKLLIDKIDNTIQRQRLTVTALTALPDILGLNVEETNAQLPYLDNYFFGVFDASVLKAIILTFRPEKIFEIGSGISTRYMRLFIDEFGLKTAITCIDPAPRTNITNVAHHIVKQPLEQTDLSYFSTLIANDIVFLDGSHYTFRGNDTLTFFFKIFPALPPGIIVHIHDIYLPFDYADNVAPQLWTEQYLIAAWLMGGHQGYEILFPAYYVSVTDRVIKQQLASAQSQLDKANFKLNKNHSKGFSFWIRKTI